MPWSVCRLQKQKSECGLVERDGGRGYISGQDLVEGEHTQANGGGITTK